MATLNEAPAQLRQWIKELDGQIGYLTEQRDAFVLALTAFGDPDDIAAVDRGEVAAPDRAKITPGLEEAEVRRAADRNRKAKARERAKKAPKASTPKIRSAPGESKYDFAEVARVANAGVRAGHKPMVAIRQHFGVSDAMAYWLQREARTRGHEIKRLGANKPIKPRPVPPTAVAPIAANLRIVEDNTVRPANSTVFDADLVAETYREAVRAGRRPVQTIVDRFDVSKELAQEWVTRTRAEGKLPPAGEPQLPASERRALLDEFKPEPVA